MPKVFSFADNYDESVRFIAKVRAAVNRAYARRARRPTGFFKTKPRYYELEGVRKLSPATALVFAAEYDRGRSLIPDWKLATYNAHRWKPEVRQLLKDIGFFELLEIDPPGEMKPGNMRMTRFAASDKNFGNEEAMRQLTEVANLLGLVGRSEEELALVVGPLRLFDALIEATENTRLHAYDENADDAVVRRWWMTGAVDRDEGRLTVVVYDQGATIPATLPRSVHRKWYERAWKRVSGQGLDDLSPENDAVALRLAMSRGISSMELEHRGKGLQVLKRVVGTCPRGRLQVNSRHGDYIFQTGKKPQYIQRSEPISGTLIQWDLWRPDWKLGK